jgi:cytoskeletal protein CcmA (bactofilin family)
MICIMDNTLRVSWASLMVGVLIIPVSAMAADVRTGETLSLPPSETVNNGLYLFGGNISNGGKVNGDLVLGGGNISVTGPVSQDVLAGGGTVSILSDVGGDVRIGGGNIQILGKVGNDVVVGGGQTQISGAVGGDIVWAGGTLVVNGPVAGKLQLTGGQVTINSHVSGNVTFTGTDLTLGKGAVIDGTLDYTAAKEAVIEEGAMVKGKTTYTEKKSPVGNPISEKGIIAILSALFLGKFLASLLFALVLGLAFKRCSLAIISNATAHPFIEIGRGLITLIVLPIASIIALITILGIPFGVLGLLIFGALCLAASAFASVLLGTLVHKQFYKPEEYQLTWKTVLVGVLTFSLLGFIPLLGGIAKFVLVLLALGSLTKVILESSGEWR